MKEENKNTDDDMIEIEIDLGRKPIHLKITKEQYRRLREWGVRNIGDDNVNNIVRYMILENIKKAA